MSLAIPQDMDFDPPVPPPPRWAACPFCGLPLIGKNLATPTISFGRRTEIRMLTGCDHADAFGKTLKNRDPEQMRLAWNDYCLNAFPEMADRRGYTPGQRMTAATALCLHDPEPVQEEIAS